MMKVSEIKYLETTLRSLLLADRSVVRSEEKRRRKRDDDDNSNVRSTTDDTGVFSLVPSPNNKRIQLTSERESDKFLVSDMQ